MSNAGDEFEKYLARRRLVGGSELADWERDRYYLALSSILHSADLEGSALGRESSRSRMRIRYEGFKMIINAKKLVEALHAVSAKALANWGIEVQDE